MNATHRLRPLVLSLAALTAIAGATAVQAARGSDSADAQQPANTVSGTALPPLTKADRTFVDKAAIGGMTEVQLGTIAQKNAASEQVKAFGARMVKDHTAANDELKQLATEKGVVLPPSIDKSHRKDVDKFSKLTGADFDKQYTAYMVSDHKEDIEDYAKAAESAQDSGVKAFAAKTLPTLRMHLEMAQSAEGAVKGGK